MDSKTTHPPAPAAVDQPVQSQGAVTATLVRFSPTGEPILRLSGASGLQVLAARSCVRLTNEHLGRHVLVLFEDGRPDVPIVIGVLQPSAPSPEWAAEVDGARVTLSAKEEIVLRCGQASITLTKAGKILIRGAYLSNHSSGVNRIKGATVEIN